MLFSTRDMARIGQLITDLLSFARIDAGRVSYDIEELSLHETLASLESLIAPQLESRKLAYAYRPCGTDLMVRADKDRLCQILLNLLGNAIKYTPDGGSVTIACDFDHHRAHIHVRDTGRGIPAERLSQIFEPFVQGDWALNRPSEGVGLGLAISRDLATAMSGELAVTSRVGHGSTFTLTLPRAAATVIAATDASFARSADPVRL